MKIPALLFLFFVLAVSAFAQNAPPVDEADVKLLDEMQTAQNNLYNCYSAFWKDKTDAKADTLNECRRAKTGELAKVYETIARRPSALKFLLGKEMSQYYQESSARIAGVGASKADSLSDSQTQLQRIIVMQNQRIIELLEKLLVKK